MGKISAIGLFFLVGCHCNNSILAAIHGSADGIVQIGDGPQFCTSSVIEAVKQLSPCPMELNGYVVWHPEVFSCDMRLVYGCSLDRPCGDFQVDVVTATYADQTALGEELGHHLWSNCGLDAKEWYPAPGEACPDGNTKYCRSPEWSKWISDVRTLSRKFCSTTP